MRGKRIVLKGLFITRAKGKEYVYAWRGGPRLTAPLGSPEFIRQYQEAHAQKRALPESDTVAGLILEYRASRAFRDLAPATRKDHERAFPHILKQYGTAPLEVFEDRKVLQDLRKWHEGFEKDRQADKILGTLSRLLSFGMSDGLLTQNFATKLENRYTREPKPNPVSEENLSKALDAAGPRVALAMRLMARSGLARADAASLMWSHVKSDRLDKRRVKSKQRATPPMTEELAAILAEMPRPSGALTVLTNDNGKPWRADGLGKAVSAAFKAVELDHTSHDLRATYACFLMRKGATNEEASEMVGWSIETIQYIRRHYIDDEAIFQGRIAKFATKQER